MDAADHINPRWHVSVRTLSDSENLRRSCLLPRRLGDNLVDRTELEELDQLQPSAFSAAMFHLADGRTVIVYNPLNDPGRTNSDIAHTKSPTSCSATTFENSNKSPSTLPHLQPRTRRSNWLAGCLLLPRPCSSARHTPEPTPPPSRTSTTSAPPWPDTGSTPAAFSSN